MMTWDSLLQIVGPAVTAIGAGIGLYAGIRADLARIATRLDHVERHLFGGAVDPRRRFGDREGY